MNCPSCLNAVGIATTRCECGYAIIGPQTEIAPVLASIDRSVRTIKTIVLWWAILTIVGGLAWLLIMRLI